jgi:hypothetical protein
MRATHPLATPPPPATIPIPDPCSQQLKPHTPAQPVRNREPATSASDARVSQPSPQEKRPLLRLRESHVSTRASALPNAQTPDQAGCVALQKSSECLVRARPVGQAPTPTFLRLQARSSLQRHPPQCPTSCKTRQAPPTTAPEGRHPHSNCQRPAPPPRCSPAACLEAQRQTVRCRHPATRRAPESTRALRGPIAATREPLIIRAIQPLVSRVVPSPIQRSDWRRSQYVVLAHGESPPFSQRVARAAPKLLVQPDHRLRIK